jgi:hypothetical protein
MAANIRTRPVARHDSGHEDPSRIKFKRKDSSISLLPSLSTQNVSTLPSMNEIHLEREDAEPTEFQVKDKTAKKTVLYYAALFGFVLPMKYEIFLIFLERFTKTYM